MNAVLNVALEEFEALDMLIDAPLVESGVSESPAEVIEIAARTPSHDAPEWFSNIAEDAPVNRIVIGVWGPRD